MSDAAYWPFADVLILAAQLSSSGNLPAPNDLRQRIVDVLDRMVGTARAAGLAEADIAESRYAIVAFVDEQILKSNWPGRAEWMNQPLQLILYREYTAGENFFARMRALLNQGGRQVALQTYYLCLALGFRGAYGVSGDAGSLMSFASAAQQQIAGTLPSASKISPHALPRDRVKAEKKGLGPLVGLIVGCSIVVIGVVVGLEWALRSSVHDALVTMPAPAASGTR
jgi:type VI secretion system protein ImpK